MGWFDNLASGQAQDAPQDLGAFNYGTESDRIKRKRAMAQALLDQSLQPSKGQIVPGGPNGFYVGNSIGEGLLKLAATYLNKKNLDSTDADQKSLDKTSLDALQHNIDNKPWEKRAAEAQSQNEAAAELLRESRRGEWQAGSEEEAQAEAAQSYPIRAGQVSTSPLPVNAAAQALQPQRAIGSQSVQAQAPALPGPGNARAIARALREQSQARINATDVGAPGSDMAFQRPVPAAPVPEAMNPAQAQPAPQTGPTAMPQNLMQQPQGMPPQAPASDAPYRPVGDPNPYRGTPSTAEQLAYQQRIANSGPMGQQLVQQMSAKPQYQHITVKNDDGSESVVQFDPTGRTPPQTVFNGASGRGGPSMNQLKRDEFAAKAYDNASKAQEELNQAQHQYSKVQSARDLLTKYAPNGGVFSTIYSGIAKTLGNDQANQLDMALKDLAFADLRATFGGNPTEGERKAQMDVKASVERGLAPSQASLDMLAAGIERRLRHGTQQVEYWQGLQNQYRTQQPQQSAPPGASMLDAMFPRKH